MCVCVHVHALGKGGGINCLLLKQGFRLRLLLLLRAGSKQGLRPAHPIWMLAVCLCKAGVQHGQTPHLGAGCLLACHMAEMAASMSMLPAGCCVLPCACPTQSHPHLIAMQCTWVRFLDLIRNLLHCNCSYCCMRTGLRDADCLTALRHCLLHGRALLNLALRT